VAGATMPRPAKITHKPGFFVGDIGRNLLGESVGAAFVIGAPPGPALLTALDQSRHRSQWALSEASAVAGEPSRSRPRLDGQIPTTPVQAGGARERLEYRPGSYQSGLLMSAGRMRARARRKALPGLVR